MNRFIEIKPVGFLFLLRIISLLIKLSHAILLKIKRIHFRLIRKSIILCQRSKNEKVRMQEHAFLLDIEQINGQMRRLLDRNGLKYPASFVQCLVNRITMNHNSEYTLPEWYLDDKINTYNFSILLDIKAPRILQKGVDLDSVKFTIDTVIKPTSGSTSRGVYIVKDKNDIYEVSSGEILDEWEEVLNRMRKYEEKYRNRKWIVEECVYGYEKKLPIDFQFYSFYGSIPLIVEITKDSQKKYCFWNSNMEIIDVGKKNKKFNIGKGIEKSVLEHAKTISLEIPSPFVRIDFRKAKNGVYLGEFSPYPGGNDKINKKYDTILGHEYHKAETRLVKDLLNGKKFLYYEKLVLLEKNMVL